MTEVKLIEPVCYKRKKELVEQQSGDPILEAVVEYYKSTPEAHNFWADYLARRIKIKETTTVQAKHYKLRQRGHIYFAPYKHMIAALIPRLNPIVGDKDVGNWDSKFELVGLDITFDHIVMAKGEHHYINLVSSVVTL